MIINDLERTLGPFQTPLHLFIKVKMLKSHTENELISTFEDTEKMLYVVCLIKSYRMLNCAIDLHKILGNFEHRQEYISRIVQQDDFTQYRIWRNSHAVLVMMHIQANSGGGH